MMHIETGGINIIKAEKVHFSDETVLYGLHKEGIEATSNQVSLNDVCLKEPQKMALGGLVGISSSSLLVLKNIRLQDPARGALITKFNNGMIMY